MHFEQTKITTRQIKRVVQKSKNAKTPDWKSHSSNLTIEIEKYGKQMKTLAEKKHSNGMGISYFPVLLWMGQKKRKEKIEFTRQK